MPDFGGGICMICALRGAGAASFSVGGGPATSQTRQKVKGDKITSVKRCEIFFRRPSTC